MNRETSWVAWSVLKAALFLTLALILTVACQQSQTSTEGPPATHTSTAAESQVVEEGQAASPTPSQETKAPVAQGEPRKGGELRVAISTRPNHLNPALQSGSVTGVPGAQLFASLLRVDRNWQYHAYLAERWEVAADGMSVTFYLRAGATFHDGQPITSQDVAFSIMAVKEHHPFSSMLAVVERVETPDALTAIVHLQHPHPALLLVAASPMLPIMPQHVYGDGQDLKTHPANWQVVGSGPFRLLEVKDDQVVMERYPDFFLPDKPYLDRVICLFLDVDSTQVALETSAVHLYGFVDVTIGGRFETQEHLRAVYTGYEAIGALVWLAFNLEKSPVDDLRVRQAIAYAIDREFLARSLYEDQVALATGPISPGTPFYTDDVEKYELDVERANELLDQAGYPRDSKGLRFSITLDIFVAGASDPFTQMAKYLRVDLLKKIGVDLEIIQHTELMNWVQRVSNREFVLTTDSVFNWGDPVIGVHRTYSCANIRRGVIWSNTQAYCNPQVEALMEQASIEMDFDKRAALYAEFQRLVVQDLPVYWLFQEPYVTIHHRDLVGLDNSVWGTMFPYDEVYWKE